MKSKVKIQPVKGAIGKGQIHSNRQAASMYGAMEITLRKRSAGTKLRRDLYVQCKLTCFRG